MKAETKFQTKFLKLLRALPNTWICKVSQKTVSGTPDILACVNGKFVAIELKAEADSPVSDLQKYELMLILKCRGHSFLCHPENYRNVLCCIKRL